MDRCYWNADLAGQLDRTLTCTALEWVPQLSAQEVVVEVPAIDTRGSEAAIEDEKIISQRTCAMVL